MLVIDLNQILFDDHALAIDIANEAAHRVRPRSSEAATALAKLPNILIATPTVPATIRITPPAPLSVFVSGEHNSFLSR
jgi:hypothetical protein